MYWISMIFLLGTLAALATNYWATLQGLQQAEFGFWMGLIFMILIQSYEFVYAYITQDEAMRTFSPWVAYVLTILWFAAMGIDYLTTLVFHITVVGGYSLDNIAAMGIRLPIYMLTSLILVFAEIFVFLAIMSLRRSWKTWHEGEVNPSHQSSLPPLRRPQTQGGH